MKSSLLSPALTVSPVLSTFLQLSKKRIPEIVKFEAAQADSIRHQRGCMGLAADDGRGRGGGEGWIFAIKNDAVTCGA